MLGWIKGPELIVILVVVLLIFGPTKLPQLAKSIGKSITEFKKGIKSVKDDVKDTISDVDVSDSIVESKDTTAEKAKPSGENTT